jgi:hypothetical protein
MLRAIATDLIQRNIDTWGLIHLEAFYVNLHRWRFLGEEWIFCRDNMPGLYDLDADQRKQASITMSRAFENPQYQLALSGALGDFRAAVLDRQRSGMLCYRAAECLRHCFIRPGDKERSGDHRRRIWNRMQDALGISEDDIRQLERASVPSRHGNAVDMTAEQRMELMRIARSVILNFAQWAAKQPLPCSVPGEADTGEADTGEADTGKQPT